MQEAAVDARGRLSGAEARLQAVLQELAREIPEIRVLAVGSPQGLPVASISRGGNTIAGTASATLALSAARSVAENLGLPPLDAVILEGGEYRVLVQDLGAGFTILAVLEGQANLGMVKILMARKAGEVAGILEEWR